MKSPRKIKTIILIILGIFFAFSPIITTNLSYITDNSNRISDCSNDINLDNKNLKISALSGKIHIDGNSGWAAFKDAGNCTGNGTYSDPYIIKNLIIDGGGTGSCILIENSNVYFRIENCTLYNSGNAWPDAGICLFNVANGTLIDNNCTSNLHGIYLFSSNYIDISGNNASFNNDAGIYIDQSDNNTISGNTLNNNTFRGINLVWCSYNLVSGNSMNACGLLMSGTLENVGSHTIDATNLVNGKPLYYYTNEINLGSNDFLNAGQVILVNCHDSLIANLNISQCPQGISLYYCSNNEIMGNIANFNLWSGIYLMESENNNITGNTANNNDLEGIYLHNCDNNLISGNTANNNDQNGVAVTGHNNNVTDNFANNNDFSGIYIFGDMNTVLGNAVNNNNYGIYVGTVFSGNILYFNNFLNNNKNLYSSAPSIILSSPDKFVYTYNGINHTNHLGNYWDNYTGIDADNNGIGDTPFTVNGFTDYYPLMEPVENYVIIGIHEPEQAPFKITGYNLFFLLGILSIVTFLISTKVKKS